MAPEDKTGAGAPMRAEAWHALAPSEAYQRLETDDGGLDDAEAARRLETHGPNILPDEGGNETLRILIRQVRDPLIYVLIASTVLAFLTGKILDGMVIAGVVVINAAIGFIQEFRASKAIKALSAMAPSETTVLRNGWRVRVEARSLVPGDVVILEPGDRVPADLRLAEHHSLMVQEAALTGESEPVQKAIEAVDETAEIGDRTSLAFSGTLVTHGTARGLVIATGGGTELGRISAMLGQAGDLETPLTRQLEVIARWIALAIVAVSVVLLGVGLFRGYALGDAVLAAVTLAVAAIPEGLPAIVTISLAIGVSRMARRRALVRKLPAVETLGSTTVICTDKTGTLTRNEMTVQALWTPSARFRLTGTGYLPEGELQTEDGERVESVPPELQELLRAGVLCNDAVVRGGDEGIEATGDPTEAALVVACDKTLEPSDVVRRRFPRQAEIPFESERQYMATLHDGDEGQIVYLKGAPEVVLERCAGTGGPEPGQVRQVVEEMGGDGLRVLGFACRRPDRTLDALAEEDVNKDFEFLGLQGMIDPPREEAIAAVRACQEAGITVKMITGDHRTTATAIARQIGIARDEDEEAATGAELRSLGEEELRMVARGRNVFARVSPEHKLGLVKALQAEGAVVAMTGDGVNDAPALKQADIGVAMGITGTEVSKEAADMVLVDDNFATIEAAVEEGRRVYDNLVKALAFVLPTNLGLALILMVAVAMFPIVDGEPVLPMLPAQILWINLVAAVALALPLSFEAMEPDLMGRPPRRPDAPVMSPFIVGRTVLVAVLMAAGAILIFILRSPALDGADGAAEAYRVAQTQAVTTVIFFQIFYLLHCRSFLDPWFTRGLLGNPWVLGGIALVLVLQLAFIYLPLANTVFRSAPLDLWAWLEAAAVGAVILPLIVIEKVWRQRSRNAIQATRPA